MFFLSYSSNILNQKNGYNFRISKKKYQSDFSYKIKKSKNIKFLVAIKNFKGLRHSFGFPVRGQRTRTNGNTAKKKL
jgi:ribosomal protein S13